MRINKKNMHKIASVAQNSYHFEAQKPKPESIFPF